MDSNLQRFIKFGTFKDQNTRQNIVDMIISLISNEKTMQSKTVYDDSIEQVYTDERITKVINIFPATQEQINKESLEFIEICEKKVLFELDDKDDKNQKALNKFKKQDTETFIEGWENFYELSAKQYKDDKFFCNDLGFYNKKVKDFKKELKQLNIYDKTTKRLSSEDRDAQKKEFLKEVEIIHKNLSKDYQQKLDNKRRVKELQIIENEREIFLKSLYERIDNLLKLRELIGPFSDDLGRLWDLSEGLWQNVNFDVIQQYSEALEKDASLREIAYLLGRWRDVENEEEEESFREIKYIQEYHADHSVKEELVGVTENDDLAHLLPHEVALLSYPETETLFFKKFMDKKLQTFELSGKALALKKEENDSIRTKNRKQDQGPFILCIDTSGSMDGTPEAVAKMLSFALIKIAKKEKRSVYLISFSTQIKTINLTDIEHSLSDLVAFLSMSFRGGTDATPALEEAVKMLDTKEYEKADVIMVSDFIMPSPSSDLAKSIEEVKEKGTRFYSLAITSSGYDEMIETFDHSWIYDPNDDRAVKKLLKQMKTLTQRACDEEK